MARKFRICHKKRGNRRTGSERAGQLGEAAFYAVLFLLGCAGLVVILSTLVVPEWRANHVFRPTTCVVKERKLERTPSNNSPLYRPEIRIQFEVDGTTYIVRTCDIRSFRGAYTVSEADKDAVLEAFVPGEEYPCWYDPSDPRVAVLMRGYSWWFWLTLPVPVSFFLIGGGALVYGVWTWGRSAERRAALASRVAGLELFDAVRRSARDYPAIPSPNDITNSPGTTLAYRLPVGVSPGWKLAAWLTAGLLWNGIVLFFATWAISRHVEGNPDWVLTVFTIPFALIGLALFGGFLWQLAVATGIGPTLVEISDQPLRPGQEYDVLVSQTGRLKLSSLDVLLVCEEAATYQHGTNAHKETHRVLERAVFHCEQFADPREGPFDARFAITIPAGAMHSFKSEHNEIGWRLIVKGKAAGWPEYERSFPLVVYPLASSPLGAASQGRNGRSTHARNGVGQGHSHNGQGSNGSLKP